MAKKKRKYSGFGTMGRKKAKKRRKSGGQMPAEVIKKHAKRLLRNSRALKIYRDAGV